MVRRRQAVLKLTGSWMTLPDTPGGLQHIVREVFEELVGRVTREAL
jgi:hypothetical protein